jgi:hypothetical protein
VSHVEPKFCGLERQAGSVATLTPWAGRTPGTRETSTSARNRNQRACRNGPAGRTSRQHPYRALVVPEQGADLGLPITGGRVWPCERRLEAVEVCQDLTGRCAVSPRRAAILPRNPE